MELLAPILLQFLFRLSLGIAAAMGATPPRWVTAGFYRVHLWVVLGLGTFAALIAWSRPELPLHAAVGGLSIAIAVAAYVGAVIWLYERSGAGRAALWLIAGLALSAAVATTPGIAAAAPVWASLVLLDIVTSGLLLGATITAMFLGHWYLNHPGMELTPLRRLVLLMAAAIVLRGAASLMGLSLEAGAEKAVAWWLMVSLRWIAGLVLPLVLARLTWQTLNIPNTQSATGILYAAIILVFIGELTSQLLTADARYPL
jgi:hypothetical protein